MLKTKFLRWLNNRTTNTRELTRYRRRIGTRGAVAVVVHSDDPEVVADPLLQDIHVERV